MSRPLLFLAAFAAAAPAVAATYTAAPAGPLPAGRIIDRGIAWHCAGATCTGVSEESRPALICERFVRERGALTRFAVDGKPFDDSRLAACNRVAKTGGATLAAAR